MPDELQPVVDALSHDECEITVSDEQDAIAVDGGWLCRIARSVLRDEGVTSAQISIALVDDPTIHDINRRFLQHDYPTDVISFRLDDAASSASPLPLHEPAGSAVHPHVDGEVVISGETAARCAAEQAADPRHELALYLVHGLLHLCGYDDHSDEDRRQMRRREKSHLQKFGILPHYGD